MVLDRKKFSEEQPAMNTDALVFLDESGVSTALSNGFAWSRAGEKAVVHAPIHAKRLTIIGAIAADGLRGKMEVEGSMDGETFKRFLDEQLGPNLRRGDVVVMDRLRAHQVAGVDEILSKWGATALYLPPYSPEYNPIEICWAWLKRTIRKVAPGSFTRLREVMTSAWASITPELCAAWTRHCGYQVVST